MFLSNGGTNIATPINSAVGIGETKVLQANLASNLNATTFVSGNSNTVLDTAGNSNWQFYVAPSTSVAAITNSSNSTEWTGGTVLSANDTFPGTLLFGATYVADAGSRVPGKNYLKLPNSTGNAKCARISPFTPTTNGISFSFWIRHTTFRNTVFFFNFRDANTVNETCMGNFWFGYPNDLSVVNNTGSLVSTGIPFTSVADGNWHHAMGVHRRLNVILYLNKFWDSKWGGALELWDEKLTKCVKSIDPLFNRLVVFETHDLTYHGHPTPLLCPPDQSRKSLILYYYTASPRPKSQVLVERPHRALWRRREMRELT